MKLEELINKNYNKLNENDFLVLNYIQTHKKECCDIAIEDLAKKCSISRATISRLAQKLSFSGFREFKMRLKLEYEKEQVSSAILLNAVCENYQKCIDATKDTNMDEICDQIFHANRLFAFATGEVQNMTISVY